MVASTPAAGSKGSTAGTGRLCQVLASAAFPSSPLKSKLGAGRGSFPSIALTWRSTPRSCSPISSADWNRDAGLGSVAFTRNSWNAS